MKTKLNVSNQVHPPLPKKKRVDEHSNDLMRLWLKDGDSTMLIIKGLTRNGCKALINSINSNLIKLGKEPLPTNKFLITR